MGRELFWNSLPVLNRIWVTRKLVSPFLNPLLACLRTVRKFIYRMWYSCTCAMILSVCELASYIHLRFHKKRENCRYELQSTITDWSCNMLLYIYNLYVITDYYKKSEEWLFNIQKMKFHSEVLNSWLTKKLELINLIGTNCNKFNKFSCKFSENLDFLNKVQI